MFPIRITAWRRRATVTLVLAPFLTAWMPSVVAQTDPVPVVSHTFNSGTPIETGWIVAWNTAPGRGFYIVRAHFRPGPGERFIQVLSEAGLAEIFVPYHEGSPRFYDLAMGMLVEPTGKDDLGCCGTVLGKYVIKEIRDRGIAWKRYPKALRGQELVLWATLQVSNYAYIIEYGFRDDGTISFRLGATGYNLDEGYPTQHAHMHDGLWRIDVDLDGGGNDVVLVTRHRESASFEEPEKAFDSAVSFNRGREGFADWQDLEFTELQILDYSSRNANGKRIGYDLKPLRTGTSRHFGPGPKDPGLPSEEFSHHDFWVTRFRQGQLQYENLPAYVNDQEEILRTNVVLWYNSPIHHLPRDEDENATLVMWGGFELRPRNFFHRNPLKAN